MSSPSLRRLSTAAAVFAILALPAAASAQYQLPTLTSAARADSLHEAAAALVAAHRWGDAARLHRRSAELRDPEDPLGFRCLKEAAQLAYAAGDRTTARTDMAAAAVHALARGDLREAALAYVDAAWIAQEQKNARQVWDLGHRAEMLAGSRLLSPSDRAAIMERISRAPEGVQLASQER